MNTFDRYRKAKQTATYIYSMATRAAECAPGKGHEADQPAALLLGKEEEIINTLTYIAMLLNDKAIKIVLKEIRR